MGACLNDLMFLSNLSELPPLSKDDMLKCGSDLRVCPRSIINTEIVFETTIDAKLYKELFGVNLAPARSFDISYKGTYQVQARKHKKKRINKKWAKKYGYKTYLKDVKIENVNIGNPDDEINVMGFNRGPCIV